MHTAKKQYEMDMCSGSILKKMLLFTLPLMLSSILQLLFNAADIVVVGKFAGDNALAAVGSNTALINLLTNLFVGFSIGANVTAARHYGAKCEKDLEETVHTSIAMSFASGFLLMIVGLIGAKQFLIWMQTPEEVLPLATLYLHIYFIGMIPNMVYNFGSALLRSVGVYSPTAILLDLCRLCKCCFESADCHCSASGCCRGCHCYCDFRNDFCRFGFTLYV